ncbi:hypothetical protein ACP275_13G009900 [Erythranthe tilingii]
MAISQTMSNPSDNWMLQYQTDFSGIGQTEVPPTTTAAAAAAAARVNNLSPDQGRVAKPIRRRSRASRRTPTTLLNTDATNFRAMVQQFTGGPAASFAARPQIPSSGGAALNYIQHASNMDPARGFHVQYPNPNQQQQQQHMFLMDSMHGGGGLPAAPPPGNASENDHQNRNYHSYMRFDQ